MITHEKGDHIYETVKWTLKIVVGIFHVDIKLLFKLSHSDSLVWWPLRPSSNCVGLCSSHMEAVDWSQSGNKCTKEKILLNLHTENNTTRQLLTHFLLTSQVLSLNPSSQSKINLHFKVICSQFQLLKIYTVQAKLFVTGKTYFLLCERHWYC